MQKSELIIIFVAIISLIIVISGCVSPPLEEETSPPSPQSSPSIKIIDVSWDSSSGIIEITLNIFPTWGNWTMYVDGEEISMEGGAGNPIIRPNAPLDKPPTGLIIGTEPWVSGLAEIDFPCCGTIQLDIPDQGLTNMYEFNLVDFGCQTASKKECQSEWIKHYGDLVINGTEMMLIEDTKYLQQGNIYINDDAKLVIKNSQVMLGRGNIPTIHTYIFVSEEASLEIENSSIFPERPANKMSALVVIRNNGNLKITDSPTSVHLLEVYDGAQLSMTNSEMVFDIGGLLQVSGGDIKLNNSTIGAIGLTVPANSYLNISDLKSGIYLESWDIKDIITNVDYNLVLEKTKILKDELEPGPYERGWIFFIDPQAHAKISDSELRKVFLNFKNEKIKLENLKIGLNSSLNYSDIELNNIIINGQWGFTILDSDITIYNSTYLFIQISGESTLNMIDSHMVEFIPRDFFGTIIFENCTWTNAGEIIGGIPYHSMENNFTIRGSLKISHELKEHLQWQDAQVERIYDILVLDKNGQPIEGISINIDGKNFSTDNMGKAKFSLIFNEDNYIEPEKLEVVEGDRIIAKHEIDFFTETPIIIFI